MPQAFNHIMREAGIGAVCVNTRGVLRKDLLKHLRIVHIASRHGKVGDEAVFFNIEVVLKPIGVGLFAIGGGLDVVPRFWALGIIAVRTFAWASAMGLADSGIDDADLSLLENDRLRGQLLIGFVKQHLE